MVPKISKNYKENQKFRHQTIGHWHCVRNDQDSIGSWKSNFWFQEACFFKTNLNLKSFLITLGPPTMWPARWEGALPAAAWDGSLLWTAPGSLPSPPPTQRPWSLGPRSWVFWKSLQFHFVNPTFINMEHLQNLAQTHAPPAIAQAVAASSFSSACPVPTSTTPTALPQALQNLRHYMHHNGINYAGERPIQLVTWYLHHGRMRRCNRYRIVPLHRDPRRWARQIVNIWRDLISPDEAYNFIVVRPDPPGEPQPDQSPTHVILQQHPQRAERSVLLTGLLPTHTPGMLWHWATVIAANANKAAIVRAAGADPFCQPITDDRRSQVWRGDRLFAHHEDFQTFPGDSILLVVNTLQISESIPRQAGDEQDDIFLMQQHFPSPSRFPNTWRKQVWNYLQAISTADGFCEPSSMPSLQTWYIDHDHARHCFEAREWQPSAEGLTWETQLRRIWYDMIDPQQGLRIVTAKHEPFHGHLLLIQGSQQYKGLFVYAPAEPNVLTRPIQIAVSTFAEITREQIIRHLGLTMLCDDHPCDARLRSSLLAPVTPTAIDDGDVAQVVIRHHVPSDIEETDVLHLMARSIVPAPPPEADIPPEFEADDAQPQEAPESSEGHLTDDAVDLPAQAVWHATVLFRVGQSGQHCRLRSDDYEIRHRQAAHYLGLTRHELLRLHPTRSVPFDLLDTEWPLLAQAVGDIRPGASTKLVLIDTEFHNHPPSLEPETVRQCKAIPKRLSRDLILSILGLIPYCRHTGPCLLWINHRLIGSDDASMLLLEHGDYIRIAVPPSQENEKVNTRTAALCHHHELGPADYDRVSAQMPEHMDYDQMPTQEGHIHSLWFNDDLASYVQLQLHLTRSLPRASPAPLGCRLPDDPEEPIRQCRQLNALFDRNHFERTRLEGLLHLPTGLQELQEHLLQLAPEEDESTWGLQTWYLNHRTAWRCNIGRPVLLSQRVQVQDWQEIILSAWRDELDDDMPINYHLVAPRPYDLEHGVLAHLIIVQPERFDLLALLLSVYDNAVNEGRVHRFAFLHGPHVTLDDLIEHADRDQVCHFPDAQCEAWYGWEAIPHHQPYKTHSSAGFTLSILRPDVPYDTQAWEDFELGAVDPHFHMLQRHSSKSAFPSAWSSSSPKRWHLHQSPQTTWSLRRSATATPPFASPRRWPYTAVPHLIKLA